MKSLVKLITFSILILSAQGVQAQSFERSNQCAAYEEIVVNNSVESLLKGEKDFILFGPFDDLIDCLDLEGQIDRMIDLIERLIEEIERALRRRDPNPVPMPYPRGGIDA